MKRTSLLAACAITLVSSTARAEPRENGENGEVVVDDGDVIEIRVNPGSTSTLYFAGPITNAIRPGWPGVEVHRQDDRLTVHAQVLPLGIDEFGSFPVDTAAGSVVITLRAAATPADTDERCRVIPRTHRRLDLAAKQVAADMCSADLTAKTRQIEVLQRKFASASEIALVDQMFTDEIRVPIDDPVPDEPWGVHIQAVAWVIKNHHTYLLFKVHNRGDRPYPVANIQLLNTDSSDASAVTARSAASCSSSQALITTAGAKQSCSTPARAFRSPRHSRASSPWIAGVSHGGDGGTVSPPLPAHVDPSTSRHRQATAVVG